MRRRRPERRQIHPDPVYKDLLVAKFVNNLMMDGKKSIAEKMKTDIKTTDHIVPSRYMESSAFAYLAYADKGVLFK